MRIEHEELRVLGFMRIPADGRSGSQKLPAQNTPGPIVLQRTIERDEPKRIGHRAFSNVRRSQTLGILGCFHS